MLLLLGSIHSTAMAQVTARFKAASSSSAEGTANSVEVVLSQSLAVGVYVYWTFDPGTANSGNPGGRPDFDFCGGLIGPCVIGSLLFNPGQTNAFIPFSSLDDALDEFTESFSLTLSPPTGADTNRFTLGTPTTHVHSILDNDPIPVVRFLTPTSGRDEADVLTRVAVELSAPSGKTVSVNWAQVGGTATTADYSIAPRNGTLVFGPGEVVKFIEFRLFDDLLEEPDKTVSLVISNPTNATLGTFVHVFTILDNDAKLSWVSISTSVPERTEFTGIPLRLSRPLTYPFTVEVANISRSADLGVDWTNATQLVLFSPGQTNALVNFRVFQDSLDEFDEIAELQLRNPTAATIFGPTTSQVTIVDDDPSDIPMSFTTGSTVSIGEGVGSVQVDVRLGRISGRPVWASLSLGGTTAFGEDYRLETMDGVTLSQVVFNEGQTNASFRVVILNDTLFEAAETLELTLAGFNGAVAGAIPTRVFRIEADPADPAPTAAFENVSSSFGEATTVPSIPVVLSASSGRPVKVNVAVSGGTARDGGVDYSLLAGTLFFEPGEIRKNVSLRIVDDVLDEDAESFVLTLSPNNLVFPPDGYAAIGVRGITNRTFEIVDNDAPPVASVAQLLFQVVEGASTNAVVRLSRPSGRAVSVGLTVAGGNAVAADVQIRPSTVSFQPGETEKEVVVSAFRDFQVEGDEAFLLTLVNPIGVTVGAARAFFIQDADGQTVEPNAVFADGRDPGHAVRLRKASGTFLVAELRDADKLLSLDVRDSLVAFEVTDDGVPTLNYVDAKTDAPPQGHAGADRDFHAVTGNPTFADGPIDHFALEARGFLKIPTAGNWNFIVRSDDGFRLRIGSAGTVVASFEGGRAAADSVAVVNIPTSGFYAYSLTYFENEGNAQVEFLAQPPQVANTPQLVGSGEDGLQVFRAIDTIPTVQPRTGLGLPGALGHRVEFRKSSGVVNDIPGAQALFDLPETDSRVLAVATDHGVGVLNYDDASGSIGLVGGDRPVASPPLLAVRGAFLAGGDDHFAMRATGYLQITNPGVWNLVVQSDDGFRLRLGTNLPVVGSFTGTRGQGSTTNRVFLPAAGLYPYELLYFESLGGALVEFLAQGPGGGALRLVGDPAGEIRVFQTLAESVPMGIAVSGARTTLSWPAEATSFRLESTSDLGLQGWSQVTTPPVNSGGRWSVSEPVPAVVRFYRLRRVD
jgi:hypothetical protein